MNNLPEGYLRSHLQEALKEDHVREDTTTLALQDRHEPVEAALQARETGVLAGRELMDLCVDMVAERPEFPDTPLDVEWTVTDGDSIDPDTRLATIEGPASILLSAERVGLNYLQQLSGVATLTSRLVAKADPYDVDVYDTRKTVPHLRQLQKYAVRCGDGHNHRMNLSEAVMIKDNHKALAGGLEAYLENLQTQKPVVVEIHNSEELKRLETTVREGRHNFDIEVVMLDNFTPEMIQEAIDSVPQSIDVEVSGGIGETNIEAYCQAGPDRVSVGALTHSFESLDLSLNLTSHLTP